MASNYKLIFLSILLILSLALNLTFIPSQVHAQDYSEEEYALYKSADEEADPAKKTDMILQFFKEYPESSLKPYLVATYQRLINDLYQNQQWAQVISLGTKFLTIVPDEPITIQALTYAYSATNNQKGFITFATKMYETTPNPDMAYAIAVAYLRIKNDAQFLKWGDKVLNSSPGRIEILVQMLVKTSGARQEKYANMALKALPTAQKPEGMTDQVWKDTVNSSYAMSYGILGGAAYEDGNYGPAIKHLVKAVEYNKKNETAYYFLGMSYWQSNQIDKAMLNFAKAYLLKGSTSTAAKGYLEQLWKQGHRDSLKGMDSIVKKAQQELG